MTDMTRRELGSSLLADTAVVAAPGAIAQTSAPDNSTAGGHIFPLPPSSEHRVDGCFFRAARSEVG